MQVTKISCSPKPQSFIDGEIENRGTGAVGKRAGGRGNKKAEMAGEQRPNASGTAKFTAVLQVLHHFSSLLPPLPLSPSPPSTHHALLSIQYPPPFYPSIGADTASRCCNLSLTLSCCRLHISNRPLGMSMMLLVVAFRVGCVFVLRNDDCKKLIHRDHNFDDSPDIAPIVAVDHDGC
jgi:hypothetical protein